MASFYVVSIYSVQMANFSFVEAANIDILYYLNRWKHHIFRQDTPDIPRT